MAECVTLLGFAAADAADKLTAALMALPGPRIVTLTAGGVTVVAQHGGARRSRNAAGALSALAQVQRRLEVACLNGAFLPADPAHAACPLAELQQVLNQGAETVSAALDGPGRCHQWDVILRWRAEDVLATQREAVSAAAAAAGGGRAALAGATRDALETVRASRAGALRATLAAASLAIQEAGHAPTETGLTVLIQAGGEAALEAALQALPDAVTKGATADLRGPLPPVSFAAVQVERRSAKDVALAWRMLDLPAQADADTLRSRWRATAHRLHPDHGAHDAAPMDKAAQAMRLLRGLLSAQAVPASLAAVQQEARARLRLHLAESVSP